MNYSYEEFKSLLLIGMEYSVYFKGRRYDISQRKDLGEIYFTITPENYDTFTSYKEFLKAPLLEGKTLFEQWNFIDVIG